MDALKTKEILARVARIGAALESLRGDFDAEALQVGDRQFFDRSLDAMASEATALADHLESMLADETKN